MDINSLKNKVIYQVFVRDFTPEGTLKALTAKLDYIKSLGVDILYLMPIFPIGKEARKGSYGSPYAISDYEMVNPDLGSDEDLDELIAKAHQKGLKIMLDIVYNHTSRDSKLLKEHPEYFYKDKRGNFANKVGDWSDVYDLDHSVKGLDKYLVKILVNLVKRGVDGFRFDVASLIPASFFKRARRKIDEVNKDVIFLAENIDYGFINYTRSLGFNALSNQELVNAGIDLLYHYSSFQPLRNFFKTKKKCYINAYKAAINVESSSISNNALIIRNIENHDNPRIASYSDKESFLHNLLAFSFFTMGPAFLYMGEELKLKEKPSLFEKEPIDLKITDQDYFSYVLKLINLKKRRSNYNLLSSQVNEDVGPYLEVTNTYKNGKKEYGLFSLLEEKQVVTTSLPNGQYQDLLSGKKVTVKKHQLEIEEPLYLVRI